MKLAVVIPALEEADRIRGAISSARASDVEIWVVDGGSRDATASVAREAGARVLASAPGRARQLDTGLREAAGEAVVFLHADSELPPGWDAAVRAALRDPAVVGGAFALRFDRRGAVLRLVEWGAHLRHRLAGLPYGDQALFARRAALLAAGGVPQVPILEDLDLVRTLRARGRLARLPLPVTTSARRYLEGGVVRTWWRNTRALAAWSLGLDRARIAGWYRR